MSAYFDFRSIRDIVVYPAKLIFGNNWAAGEMRDCSARPTLFMRWRRGKDGKLESRWERDE